MIAAELDRTAQRAHRRRQLETDCVRYGADPGAIGALNLETLFELRWTLLHRLMGSPRR